MPLSIEVLGVLFWQNKLSHTSQCAGERLEELMHKKSAREQFALCFFSGWCHAGL